MIGRSKMNERLNDMTQNRMLDFRSLPKNVFKYNKQLLLIKLRISSIKVNDKTILVFTVGHGSEVSTKSLEVSELQYGIKRSKYLSRTVSFYSWDKQKSIYLFDLVLGYIHRS